MTTALVSVLILLLLSVDEGVIALRTPFGERPAECVLEVPHGSRVEQHPDRSAALLITTPEGNQYRHETPSTCWKEMSPSSLSAASHGGACPDPTCNDVPCTCNDLPCNNWIDNAGSMNTTTFIGSMSAQYVTPQTPKVSPGPQTLFYFIGAENTEGCPRSGDPPPSGRAILQPVLTYDPTGWCVNSTTGWCFSSWYCCPANLTVHSPYLINVQPGDVYLGEFSYSAATDEFVVTSQNIKNPKQVTALKCPRQGRNFNWADITLEVYAVATCDHFAQGPMWFNKTTLRDLDGVDMVPNWQFTSKKPCKGVIETVDANKKDFYVQHN